MTPQRPRIRAGVDGDVYTEHIDQLLMESHRASDFAPPRSSPPQRTTRCELLIVAEGLEKLITSWEGLTAKLEKEAHKS